LSLEHSPTRQAKQTGAKDPWTRRDPNLADRFVSRREAAEYLGLTTSQLAHDVVHGRLGIPYHRFGQRARYRLSELDAWAEEQRRQPGKAA
jgi:excisionase family DNA binding protein